MSAPLLFCTENYTYLYEEVAALMNSVEKGSVERRLFPDGERYQCLLSDVEGRDVMLIGGTISDVDTLELYDLAYAIAKYGAKSLRIVVPFFGYSTMERAVRKGEVVTAKTRARLLSAIPNTGTLVKYYLLDLHTEGIPHYFEGSVTAIHIYAKPVIIEAARHFGGEQFVLACTDAGRAKWVESLANDMGVEAAFVFKKRLGADQTAITGVNADVEGKTVIIYDDMIRTGGSLVKAAQAYKNAGARRIIAITTHGLFVGECMKRLEASRLFEKVIATNTHPNALRYAQHPLVEIRSVAALIARHLSV
ncbi:ribose-phosphate pyrophosphokinase [Thermonema lapsum]|uniref:ribose-phosphate diphosphokinase n=1 Tax=Thermonema lapsum TaxID=28195 RepID=A0A846MU58_9BACT|nr:ribose-phosphate diphosphokinase [Thermonema lapsum]NIK74840.1 ribose-phosphate pyrophosphokinase [Thermonema lapsum]